MKRLPALLSFFLILFLLPSALSHAANSKIVGGELAPDGGWPSQAAVYTNLDLDTYLCGGTVIHPRWVVTAAHCLFDGARVDLVLGSNDRTTTAVKSKRFIIYPEYDFFSGFGDLGLIELAEPTVQPRAKIAKAKDKPLFKTGDPAYITGWGTTCFEGPDCLAQTLLRQAEVAISNQRLCRRNYREAGMPLSANVICAGAPGRDSCQGDSGGPLMIDNYQDARPQRLLLGVVSWGIGCAEADYPGVYTDLTKYRSWIGAYVSYLRGPTFRSFARVKLEQNTARRITFKNTGILPILITNISLSGSGHFQIKKTTCKKTLLRKEKCTVRVSFRSKKAGKKSAKLFLKNGAKKLRVVKLEAIAKR